MITNLLGRGKTYASLLLVAVLFCAGCAARVRYYDSYGRDYHDWDAREQVYYHEYWTERHEPYRDYGRLTPEEQNNYWKWRHDHYDHDHDHDHDHDRDHDRH
jgi:hypothetical protein